MKLKRFSHSRLALALAAAALLVALGALAGDSGEGSSRAAAVLTVTNTADSGPGSLRQALMDAAAGDTILFSAAMFPPSAPVTITLASRLPAITQDGLTIDGSNAGVVLDGSGASGPMTPGLDLQANGVTVWGLQIVRFTGYGIELRGQGNTVGGERQTGSAPFGRGNLLSGNGEAGIGLFGLGTSLNTVWGNLIGLDRTGLHGWGNLGDGVHINSAGHNTIQQNAISGNGASGIQGCCNTGSSHNTIHQNLIGVGIDGEEPVPNGMFGVWFHDGASDNTVGPENVIAHNTVGVQIDTPQSAGNTVSRNSLYGNTDGGIRLDEGGNGGLAPPSIMSFNLALGSAWGRACSGCTVELFSDQGDQGQVYQGAAAADAAGFFLFDLGAPLTGPHLTATATHAAGNTSPFSEPTSGSGVEWVIQSGNYRPITRLVHKRSSELAENHIGGTSATPRETPGDMQDYLEKEVFEPGIKRVHLALNEGEEPIDWSRPEFEFDQREEAWITAFGQNGVSVAYVLSFWDKANHPEGWPPITSRFTTEEEIRRYLDYVRFVVAHLKDRVTTFDLWNEPDNQGSRIQYIEPADFVELIRRTVPVIREEFPQARIMVGSVSYLRNPFALDYLYSIIQSDVMPLVDVVAWHPMYGTSPDYEEDRAYYTAYPGIVREIKETAIAHGFAGVFRGDEIYWCSPDCSACASGMPQHSNVTAAKYLGRGIVTHLGLGVEVGSCTSAVRTETFALLSNLATLFAGADAQSFPLQVQTAVTNVVSYTFALPAGAHLAALWTDGQAVEDDAGVEATLVLPGLAGQSATGIDPLHSLVQRLESYDQGTALVIPHLRIKDYPLLVRLSPIRRSYLPAVRR